MLVVRRAWNILFVVSVVLTTFLFAVVVSIIWFITLSGENGC